MTSGHCEGGGWRSASDQEMSNIQPIYLINIHSHVLNLLKSCGSWFVIESKPVRIF
jgi:hypothetical protein